MLFAWGPTREKGICVVAAGPGVQALRNRLYSVYSAVFSATVEPAKR